jgi:hypothetical protein
MKITLIAPVLKRVSSLVAEVSGLVVTLFINELVLRTSDDNIQPDLFR